MSIRQYVISDPANIVFKQSQKDITGTPSTVWQQQMVEACTQTQYIIHSDHPYLYRRNNLTKDSETQFRPLQTVEDYNPQYYDPEYGKDPYWDDDLYDKHNLQFRNDDYPPTDDEDDPDIVDTKLSRALIEPWQPNFDAMQIDLLPNLPTSGGYQTVMTAIDVFSRYLFAYPLVEATASNTAKVLIDIMTKHTYLPTTIITDKGTAFTSKIIAEITEILGITLKCATTKHPQTIGKLLRTHASLKTNLKMASVEYRRQWHKYLPLAVLNYNTTYHSSIGCEPSKVFHGRIPYNVLDHKLGNNPNEDFLPTTEFAEELQQRTQILIDKTKHNIMQSYLKYKEYYDRKAKAAPLSEQDFCFILQPKADNQGSKIPFREYRWIGPYRIEKVLPNDNYIVRRLNTNKTQILHRIRLKKFVPNTPLEDKYSKEKLQPDEEIIIPQDDLYTISWEADFDYQVFGPRRDDNTNEELQTDNDASTTTRDYVIDEDADYNARMPGTATSRDSTITRDANDVTEANENEARPRTANSRDAHISNDDDDVNNNTANDKRSSENERPSTATSRDNQTYGDTPTELHNEIDDSTKRSPNRGEDDPVPGISDDERNEKIEGNSSPRGGKYNLRPNPTPNYTDEYRY